MSSEQSSDLSSDQLPFETAPELVPEIIEHVDAPRCVGIRAVEIAQRFGGVRGDHINHAPGTIAAASVWIAASFEMLDPSGVTQQAAADAVGLNPVCVRNAKRRILNEMGVTA